MNGASTPGGIGLGAGVDINRGKRVRRCRKCDGPKPEVGGSFIFKVRLTSMLIVTEEDASLFGMQEMCFTDGSSLPL